MRRRKRSTREVCFLFTHSIHPALCLQMASDPGRGSAKGRGSRSVRWGVGVLPPSAFLQPELQRGSLAVQARGPVSPQLSFAQRLLSALPWTFQLTGGCLRPARLPTGLWASPVTFL